MSVFKTPETQAGTLLPPVQETSGDVVLVTARRGFLGPREHAMIDEHFPSNVTVCEAGAATRLLQSLKPHLVLVEVFSEACFRVLARVQASAPSGSCMAIVRASDTRAALRAMREGAADVVCFDSEEDLSEQLEEVTRRHSRRVRRGQQREERLSGNVEGDLLLGTSHDLKGPLGVILTSAELLGSLPEDPVRKKQLTACIASSARGAITLLDSIVSVQKMADGVLSLQRQNLDVAVLLADLIDEYSIVAEAQKVRLGLGEVDKALQVNADRIALQRILANLVHNAIKYTPSGGCVTLSARMRRACVEINVKDTGRGIPNDQLKDIFERYSRLAEHKNIEGTGLGLYVSNALAKAHNGSLKVRSVRDQGSVFTLKLPLGQ